jgi:phage gpG-like protein
MLKITITLDDREVREALARLIHAGRDMTPAMRGIALELKAETEENFEAQGRPRWRDLSEATKKRRRKQGTWPGMILSVSGGGLRGSAQPYFGTDYAMSRASEHSP